MLITKIVINFIKSLCIFIKNKIKKKKKIKMMDITKVIAFVK